MKANQLPKDRNTARLRTAAIASVCFSLLAMLLVGAVWGGASLLTSSPISVAVTPARALATGIANRSQAAADSTHITPMAAPTSDPLPDPATQSPQSPAQSTPNLQLPLARPRIGLDPGHGPRGDLGAVLVDPNTGKLVLSEAEFNLDVALRCRDLLHARGASVVLTRETADTFTAPGRSMPTAMALWAVLWMICKNV